MKTKIRFNLMALAVALAALLTGVCTVFGGTPTNAAPVSTPVTVDGSSLRDFLSNMFGPASQPPDGKFNGPQLYALALDAIANTHIKLVDPQKRQAFLKEWSHKFDASGMLNTEEGVDIAASEALYSLQQRFDLYLNVNNTAAEKHLIDPTVVGIGVAVAIKSQLPPEMLEEILPSSTNHPATQPASGAATRPAATNAPATTSGAAATKPATKPTTNPDDLRIAKNDPYIVIKTIEGGPAEQAGLQPGDEIVMVDDQPLVGLTSEQARGKITGKEGIVVKITVDRRHDNGTVERKDFSIVRKRVVQHVVHSKDLGDGVTYVKLDDFMSSYAEAEMKDALTNAAKGKGLVLDLRGNGGGRVDAARAIISYMVNDGTMLSILERVGDRVPEHKWVLTPNSVIEYIPDDTRPDVYRISVQPRDPVVIPPDMPIAVLIDGHSASAAEMTSGALQFNHRAVTVGQNSYGKGIGQSVIGLPWGRELHVTSLEFRPAGHAMDWVGIIADVPVAVVKGHDAQLDAAKKVVLDALKKHQADVALADQLTQKHKQESDAYLSEVRKAFADQDSEYRKQHPAPTPASKPGSTTQPTNTPPDDFDGN
jgi:C-terminal processing protease CtpA/Prc